MSKSFLTITSTITFFMILLSISSASADMVTKLKGRRFTFHGVESVGREVYSCNGNYWHLQSRETTSSIKNITFRVDSRSISGGAVATIGDIYWPILDFEIDTQNGCYFLRSRHSDLSTGENSYFEVPIDDGGITDCKVINSNKIIKANGSIVKGDNSDYCSRINSMKSITFRVFLADSWSEN